MVETTHAVANTFPRLMQQHARNQPSRPAFREKDLGIWQTWTWAEVAEETRARVIRLTETDDVSVIEEEAHGRWNQDDLDLVAIMEAAWEQTETVQPRGESSPESGSNA